MRDLAFAHVFQDLSALDAEEVSLIFMDSNRSFVFVIIASRLVMQMNNGIETPCEI